MGCCQSQSDSNVDQSIPPNVILPVRIASPYDPGVNVRLDNQPPSLTTPLLRRQSSPRPIIYFYDQVTDSFIPSESVDESNIPSPNWHLIFCDDPFKPFQNRSLP